MMTEETFFRYFEIERYRGFDHLRISGLTGVNVFVGTNNVGKSSILESLFLLSGMSNPALSLKVNYLRNPVGADLEKTRYLFHKLDLSGHPELRAVSKKGSRRLMLKPTMRNDVDPASDPSSGRIGKMEFLYDTNQKGEYSHRTSLTVDSAGILKQEFDDNYKEQISALFIPAEKNDSNVVNTFANLVKRNKRQTVIDALRRFDPMIEMVEILPDGLYVKLSSMEELLPLNYAGDGIRRLLNILSSIACGDYDLVLVDEIDTGLHYSAHKLLWAVLLDFVKDRNIQLFATTHNLECIQGLDKVVGSNEAFEPLVSVFNVRKTLKEGFQAYKYSDLELREAIRNEIEIR